MRPFLLTFLAITALLFTANEAEARGKNYGGFKVGDSFKLKVRLVSSVTRTGLMGAETAAPIPAGFPSYKKNDVVRFKIGAGGKLISKGLKIPFAHFTKSVAEFNRSTGTTVNVTHTAEVERKGKRVRGAYLYLFQIDSSGTQTVYSSVKYKLI